MRSRCSLPTSEPLTSSAPGTKTGTEPVYTNGQFNANSGQITWKAPITERKEPDNANVRGTVVCYAVWAQPDEEFQKRVFGKAELDGEKLIKFCVSGKGLTDEQAEKLKAATEGEAVPVGRWNGKGRIFDDDFKQFADDWDYIWLTDKNSPLTKWAGDRIVSGEATTRPTTQPAGQ